MSATPTPPAPTPSAVGVLTVTMAVQALASGAMILPAVLGPVATPDYGIDSTAVGLYMALVYLAAMLTSVIGGSIVGRFGAMRCSQVSLLLCAAGLLLLASAEPWLGVLGALLIGVGYGPITPASSFLLMRSTPKDKLSLVFSIKQTGVPLGGVIAAVGGAVLESWVGWRVTLGLFAVAALLCAVATEYYRASLDTDKQANTPVALLDLLRPVALVWKTPALRIVAVCSLFFSFVQLAATAFLVTYLNLSLGWTLVMAGMMMSVTQVAGVVGRIGWGFVADRWMSPRRLLAWLALLMAVSCLLTAALTPDSSVAWVAGVAALYGVTAIGWNGVFLAEVARRAPPGQAGRATGGTLVYTYLGVLIGQPLFGGIAALGGPPGEPHYSLAYLMMMIPALCCAAWLFKSSRRARAVQS